MESISKTLEVVKKYLKIIHSDYIKNRIDLMKTNNKTNIPLICDVLSNRSINRDWLIKQPLCDLYCYDLIDKDQYPDINWHKSILSILRSIIPKKYRLYYHYNHLESSSYKINYEVTIYRGNAFLNDPWGKVLCCWQTEFAPLERNEKFFEKEIIQL